jgi:hypothetical protein
MTGIHYPPPPGTTTGISGTGFGPGEIPEYIDVSTTSTPGTPQTVITRAVTGTEVFYLSSVVITCRKQACYQIKEDSTIIGSGRIGAAHPNDQYVFTVPRSVPSGKTITVVFEQIAGTSASDVEAYLIGFKTT